MWSCLCRCSIFLLLELSLSASDYHGRVTFGGLPVPGATVILSQASEKFNTVTDQEGLYSFSGLPDGQWTIEVDMLCFEPVRQEISIPQNTPPIDLELKLLRTDQINSVTAAPIAAPSGTPRLLTPGPEAQATTPSIEQQNDQEASSKTSTAQTQEDTSSDTLSDGFLINGSSNNGAASAFSQAAAFGNNRTGSKNLLNGSLGMIVDNSLWDARSFSLTGQDTPKPAYDHFTSVATLGGRLKIPHLLENGPTFFVGYQWTRNRNAGTDTGLMPTAAQRSGQLETSFLDPDTNAPFAGSKIPTSRLSPPALALLNLYPLPNFSGSSSYNYQVPVIGATNQDALQARLSKSFGRRDQLFGGVAFQNTRQDSDNIFNFLDTTDSLGLASNVMWSHRVGPSGLNNVGYQFSRLAVRITPYFDDRENVSGLAGIQGNDQSPPNWGPPTLTFSSGITQLTDASPSFDRNQTSAISDAFIYNRGRHNYTVGGDFRRQEFNYLSQENPRGTFTFTGALTGSDFADFLLGVPDTSTIAFGNADKYFRESVYDGYIIDDWRPSPDVSFNIGARWEYGAPITERYGRLINLDVAPSFSRVAPVLASDPFGSLTGQHFPDSLIRPDKDGIEPRVGVSWRPLSASSMIVRAGYGVYRDTSVYQTLALQMAQQEPLSKSLSVQNSPVDPLTLANGFNLSPSITPETFGVDPNFRVGYAQIWRVSDQTDLPASLQMTATYEGVKGTRGVQEFLPNTEPVGAINPCPACPTGFTYVTSNGNSTREAGQLQIRRRLHDGFSAIALYTFSKSIDDDASLGSPTRNLSPSSTNSFNPPVPPSPATSQGNPIIAQNWLNLSAERSLSSFDQRHLLTALLQYSSGMGVRGGTLLSGWRGSLLKEWTFQLQITAGSGLPETPIYMEIVPGTGITGTIRPDYTGARLYSAPPGLTLNPAAYTAPLTSQWGNAGRNTIEGPDQFTLNASMGRTFHVTEKLNLDLRVDSTNALNRVNFTAWDTIINNAQFGLPASVNPMRSLQTSLRLRF
ncbi:MAG: carboxypeptidase regulatory-like domain-containing protein [Acidobacteriaceae bacterium]|nr:carboxypeptidase regulatory-like domain-containing protein [Acidobacteriaceae bacterium]